MSVRQKVKGSIQLCLLRLHWVCCIHSRGNVASWRNLFVSVSSQHLVTEPDSDSGAFFTKGHLGQARRQRKERRMAHDSKQA